MAFRFIFLDPKVVFKILYSMKELFTYLSFQEEEEEELEDEGKEAEEELEEPEEESSWEE